LAWGILCIIAAQFATAIGNSLIEAVNILGSLFMGDPRRFPGCFYFKILGNAVLERGNC
jgi:hypothetical protein